MLTIREKAEKYFSETVSYRRHFHMNPELSGKEEQTSRFVQEHLREWGIPFKIIPDYGILGIIDSGREGKTVALRADMDALPIREESDQPYCSQVEGVGHLCGHDCHTASLLTAARILNEEKDHFSGKVHLMFQPSEEASGCGAGEMVAGGAMDGADAVFGVHMFNLLDAGQVSVQKGPRMAASLRGRIEITGKGGHGGAPHLCVDPIVTACAIVMNLQTIASRELNSQDSAVITVGILNGGTSQFAVADTATIAMTIKFFNAALADQLKESITRIAENTCAAYRASCKVTIDGFLDPVVNDEAISAIAEKSAEKLFGPDCPVQCQAWSASEDFGKYQKKAPGVFAFIGGRNADRGLVYTAHHPKFDVDEKALIVASGLYAQFAVDYLNS